MDETQEQIESHQTLNKAFWDVSTAVLSDCALVHGEAIPTDSTKLWQLLFRTDKLKFRVAMSLAEALGVLQSRRMQVLLPKDKDLTELDRSVTLEAGSVRESTVVKRLELAYELLDKRVALLNDYVANLYLTSDTDGIKDKRDGESQSGNQGDTEADQAGSEEDIV